jgi:hypothetical protein
MAPIWGRERPSRSLRRELLVIGLPVEMIAAPLQEGIFSSFRTAVLYTTGVLEYGTYAILYDTARRLTLPKLRRVVACVRYRR